MKHLSIILLILSFSASLFAAQISDSQITLQDSVLKFLKEEGYAPALKDDGLILFKCEGNHYLIAIDLESDNPMYLILSVAFSLPDDLDILVAKIAAAEVNQHKGVKTLCYDDHISIQSEMFLTRFDEFAYAFYPIMKQLQVCSGVFLEECAKVELPGRTSQTSNYISGDQQKPTQSDSYNNNPTSISSHTSTSNSSNAYVVNYPVVSGQLDKGAKIRKLTITDSYTCIEIASNNVKNGQAYEWCNIDKNTYFVIEGEGFEKYKLQEAEGINISPEKTYYGGYNKTIVFKLYFPPIPKSTKSISLTEPDSDWCFFGIQINR